MPLQPQQRALAILGGVFGGGILIAVLMVSLFTGDDDTKRAVDVEPNQPSTSTSTSLLTTTSFALPTTLPPTLPPTAPTTPGTITPGTTVIIPPSTAATTPTTKPAPVTTSTSATTPTTKPISAAAELDALLEDALLGGVPPEDPDAPGRVRVFVRGTVVRVIWALDETLSADKQRVAAREEATALLRIIQGFDRLEDQPIALRATLPDPDTGDPRRVLRLLFERETLDAIDFDAIDPLTIFELADNADIDPVLQPSPATTTTSSTSP